MSQWLNLACRELGQGITMPAGVGETVKPGQFRIGQIRGILALISFGSKCGYWRILLENRGFWLPPAGADAGALLTPG
jgi:hypothetical protein